MAIATWTCAILLVASLGVTRARCPRLLFNPLIAFFGVWLVPLAAYEFNFAFDTFFYPYARLSESADLLMSAGFLCFFLGAVAGLSPFKQSHPARLPDISEVQIDKLYTATKWLYPLFTAGVVWKYTIVISLYGSLFGALGQVRVGANTGEFGIPLLARLMTLLGYLVVLNLGIIIILRPRPKIGLLLLGAFALFFVDSSTSGSRGSIFNSILLVLSAIFLTIALKTGAVGVRRLFSAFGLGVAGIVLITPILYIRGLGDVQSISFLERLLGDNYLYLVGPIPAYSFFLDHPWLTNLPGQWTFAGIYQLIDSVTSPVFGATVLSPGTFQTYFAPITFVGPFNTATYQTYVHSDFGVWGVLGISAVMGIIAAYTFVRAMQWGRIADVQVAALMMAMVILSIRGMMSNGMMFYITLVLIALQSRLMSRGSRAVRQAQLRTEAAPMAVPQA